MSDAPTIVGEAKVINFGPRTNPTRDKYWAERGLIHHEDTETAAYTTMSVADFLRRMRGVNDMLGNSAATLAGENFAHQDEVQRQQRFVEDAMEIVYIAKEQGMPSDASARNERKRRAPVTVVMPSTDSKYSF